MRGTLRRPSSIANLERSACKNPWNEKSIINNASKNGCICRVLLANYMHCCCCVTHFRCMRAMTIFWLIHPSFRFQANRISVAFPLKSIKTHIFLHSQNKELCNLVYFWICSVCILPINFMFIYILLCVAHITLRCKVQIRFQRAFENDYPRFSSGTFTKARCSLKKKGNNLTWCTFTILVLNVYKKTLGKWPGFVRTSWSRHKSLIFFPSP